MLPTRIHCGNMIVSGEAWQQFKESHPERDFTDFLARNLTQILDELLRSFFVFSPLRRR
jgi:hypothetical protein